MSISSDFVLQAFVSQTAETRIRALCIFRCEMQSDRARLTVCTAVCSSVQFRLIIRNQKVTDKKQKKCERSPGSSNSCANFEFKRTNDIVAQYSGRARQMAAYYIATGLTS